MASLLTHNKLHRIYSAEQVRQIDHLAITEYQIAGLELMQRAGRAAFDVLAHQYPSAESIVVVVGSGNNGGDGYILANLASHSGMSVTVVCAGDMDHQSADARTARQQFLQQNATEQTFDGTLPQADIIVDALLGTGIQQSVSGAYEHVIQQMNSAQRPIVALDLPSGLHADNGIPMTSAVQATITVSFVGLKTGLLTGIALDYIGDLYFDSLGIPKSAFDQVPPTAVTTGKPLLDQHLTKRPRICYKTQFGHALLIGGKPGMPNAIRLAAEASARSGTGLVSVATHPESVTTISVGCASAMVRGIRNAREVKDLLSKATVIAIGPGLGTESWGRNLLTEVLACSKPLIIDADALTLLSQDPLHCDHWILTPHPGEAAKLLHCSTTDIQTDRVGAAREIVSKYGGTVVLKGAGTIIASRLGMWINHYSNPALATGGTGDVLTGVISGMVAQGLPHLEAAACGVYLHAQAGDMASMEGVRGTVASDLFLPLRKLLNP